MILVRNILDSMLLPVAHFSLLEENVALISVSIHAVFMSGWGGHEEGENY